MNRYKMLARDINSNPTQYRTWIVSSTPDFEGNFYEGLKSGKNKFVDFSAVLIQDDNVIADFNLPLPANWRPTDIDWDFPIRKVLPYAVDQAQLAILDGYAYMFGGKVTNKIMKADLNNPADWEDTGATLPTTLYGSTMTIIGDTIYMFGGNNGEDNGEGALDNVYSAPVSDPLAWTDHGSRLPRKIHSAALGMADGYMYIFGGREVNTASDIIFQASTSDPLTWTDTGVALPYKVYNAQFGQIDGYYYLFGGQKALNNVINTIIKAPVDNPTIWTTDGYLPYGAASGQFFTCGNDGYIIGPVTGGNPQGFTSILRCSLDNPSNWIDMIRTVPGVISGSQVAIIYDRVWLFGGSGLTAIFACNQRFKYDFDHPLVLNYANKTRVVFPATDNLNNPFEALCFPYWKTDYRM